ncbi:hypothetical protein BZA77DRAFT_376827 [Pyronema omphalodes]|nr:hypothetical protein BZA77DRAFT_376827 [Pyronema omphalodes]
MSNLLDLPPEILRRIVRWAGSSNGSHFFDNHSDVQCDNGVDVFCLRRLRLVCKQLSGFATEALFTQVVLFHNDTRHDIRRSPCDNYVYSPDRGVRLLNNIINVDSLRMIVRTFVLDFGKDQWGTVSRNIRSPFRSALQKLNLFQNLCHFKLNFPEDYVQYYGGYDGYLGFNHFVLSTMFRAISPDKCPNIQKLTINHGVPDDEIPWERDFRVVMGHITELRINFAIWNRREHSNWERMEGFPRQWLAHAAENLKFLEINNDRCGSGYNPALRLVTQDVVFRQLETLILHKYCFGKEEQFKWIYSHSLTLKNLQLIDCAIISHTRITSCNLDRYTEIYEFPLSYVTVDPWHTLWQINFPQRWYEVFDEIREKLPELDHFEFCLSSDNDGCYDIAVPEDAYEFKKAYVHMGHPNGHALDVYPAKLQDIAKLRLDMLSLKRLCEFLRNPDIWSNSDASGSSENIEDMNEVRDLDDEEDAQDAEGSDDEEDSDDEDDSDGESDSDDGADPSYTDLMQIYSWAHGFGR